MLILFCGVSGAGKSTIIDILVSEYSWQVVTTFMTRNVRENENYKIQLSQDEFDEKNRKGFFLCVNKNYEASYGTPLNEIKFASQQNDKLWVMDFPITKIKQFFSEIPHICIVIQPESEEHLTRQLNQGGRSERAKKAVEDLKSNHVFSGRKEYENIYEITNEYGKPEQSALCINNLVKVQI